MPYIERTFLAGRDNDDAAGWVREGAFSTCQLEREQRLTASGLPSIRGVNTAPDSRTLRLSSLLSSSGNAIRPRGALLGAGGIHHLEARDNIGLSSVHELRLIRDQFARIVAQHGRQSRYGGAAP